MLDSGCALHCAAWELDQGHEQHAVSPTLLTPPPLTPA
jgi:hypothetical protein